MALPAYINWTVHPEIFPEVDWLPIRWYGLLFATAFLSGYWMLDRIFKKEGVKNEWLESGLDSNLVSADGCEGTALKIIIDDVVAAGSELVETTCRAWVDGRVSGKNGSLDYCRRA